RGRRGRGRGRQKAEEAAPAAEGVNGALSLAEGFDLLRRALRELGGVNGTHIGEDPLRERMRELYGKEDEILVHRPRFGRFLRQAHGASIVDLTKGRSGYELVLRADAEAPAAEEAPPSDGRRGRRGRGRGASAAEETPAEAATPAEERQAPAVPSPTRSRLRR